MSTTPSAMEPLLPRPTAVLRDLSVEVFKASSRLAARVHPVTAKVLARALRNVNSYYSNLIEGHHTSLLDIERALADDYARDQATRDLQTLHRLHVQAQAEVDALLDARPDLPVWEPDFVIGLHRRFFTDAPAHFLMQSSRNGTRFATDRPGELRTENVRIGRHVPPDAQAVPRFMERLAEAYCADRLHGDDRLLAVAASHHRLLWVHPFLEGNGRVARLFTHAFLRRIGLDGYGLWCISRGLARREQAYKQALALADSPRQGDHDGRGALSDKALGEFCRFFLETALDQISYMDGLLTLDQVAANIHNFCARSARRTPGSSNDRPALPTEAATILTTVFQRGELPKSAVPALINASERKARDVVKTLLTEGLLHTAHHKAPLTIALPGRAITEYFPKLIFPEQTAMTASDPGASEY